MIKNIIFDLGGVLYDVRYQNIAEAFARLGLPDFDKHYSQAAQTGPIDRYEVGEISSAEFRDYVRSFSPVHLTDSQIDEAWSSILIDFPERRVKMLQELSQRYNIYLFSNTNEIHCTEFTRYLQDKYGYNIFERYFTKVYLSHIAHIRKPHPEAFQFVLDDAGILAEETLFIDDSPQHIEGAKRVGLHTHLMPHSEDVADFLSAECRMQSEFGRYL